MSHTPDHDHMTGPRVSGPGGEGVRGWTRNANGIPVRAQSTADPSVTLTRQPAEVDQAAAERRVAQILETSAVAGISPSAADMQLIADTTLAGAEADRDAAAGARLAAVIAARYPGAAHIRFSSRKSVGESPRDTWIRTATILGQDLARIDQITQSTAEDKRRAKKYAKAAKDGPGADTRELGHRLSQVYQAHDDSPMHLFTVADAAGWVPVLKPVLVTVTPAAPAPAPVAAPKLTLLERFFGRDTARAMRAADRAMHAADR